MDLKKETYMTLINGQQYTFRVLPSWYGDYWTAYAYPQGWSTPSEQALGYTSESAALNLVEILEHGK